MAVELKKIDPSCNNFELIDSNECVADSLSKINTVITKSRDAEREMIEWLQGQQPTLTLFNRISSQLTVAALNIQKINNSFRAPYTTIQVLSSQWNKKQFSVYYPEIIDVVFYNQLPQFYQSTIISYLNFYFPPQKYPITQEIYVFVSLSYTNKFDFIFEGSYQELCLPTARSANNTLSCNGCGGDNRYAFCNIRGRACGNAYRFCGTSTVRDNETFNCRGEVGNTVIYDSFFEPPSFSIGNSGLLNIKYRVLDLEDTFICRVLRFKLVNSAINGWEYVN